MLRKMIVAVGLLQSLIGVAESTPTVRVVELNGQQYIDVSFNRPQGSSKGAFGIGTLISRMRYSGLAHSTQNPPNYEVQDDFIYARISNAFPKSAPDEIRARFQLGNEFDAAKQHSSFSFVPDHFQKGSTSLIVHGQLARSIHQHIIRGGKYSSEVRKNGWLVRASSDLSCLEQAQTEAILACYISLPGNTVFISNP